MDNKTTMPSPETKHKKNPVGDEHTPAELAVVIKKLEAEIAERKTTEAASHPSVAFEKALIESIPVPVYYKDTQGRYIGANSAFLNIFGIPEQELLGKNANDITSRELAEIFSARDAELFQNPGHQEFEISMLDFKQTPHDVIFYKSTFSDANGDIAGIIGVIQDITQRKQAEDALRNSEQRFRKIIENADEIIFTVTPEGFFTFVSPAWTRILGHQIGEVIGHLFTEFIHPDYLNVCAMAITEAMNRGETIKDIEYLVRHKNGEWRWHTAVGTPLKDENGKLIYFVGIAQDITDRKKTEAALMAATEELELFFSSAIDLLCIADTGGHFRRLNHEWEKVLGYSIDELVGRRFMDFVHPDDILPTQHALSTLASQVEVVNFINRYRCKDGSYRWIEWRSIPVGEKIYAAARDITERIKTENVLRENEERYRNFVANASEGIFRTDFTQPIKIDQPYEVLVEQCTRCAIAGEVNAAFSAMYGMEPEDMIGRPFRDFSPTCGVQIADLIKTKDYRIKDREEIDYTVDGQPVNIVENYYGVVENGILKRVWGVQRDITQHKTAEKLISLQHDLAISLSAVSGLQEGLQLCLETAIKSSGMDSGGIYLFDDQTYQLNLVIHRGLSPEFVKAISIYKTDTPNTRLVMAGKPLYSQHPIQGFPDDEVRNKEAIDSIAILPINHQNHVIGCMNIASHTQTEVPIYSQEILETIAAQMGNVITRLLSEEALRESEHRFRSIFDHAQDGILVADRESQQILFGNQTISHMLGYSLEELNKLHVFDIHPESALPDVWQQFIKSGSDESPIAYEIPILRKDGSTFIAEIVNSPISLNGRPCLAGMFRDVTDRKQAEEALRNNEEMLNSLLEATPAGVGLLKDRVFIKINKALSMITGYSEQDLLGKKTRILYPDDEEFNRIGAEFYREMEKTGLGVGEARLRHKNGALIDVILCLSPFDPTDLSKGITATVLDISVRKQVENTLRENEALISSIFAAAPVGIILLKDRTILKTNEALCKITGLSEEEMLGKSTRIFYPDDEEFNRTGTEIYGKIEKEGIGIGEARFKHKNGSIIDVFLYLSPLDPADISKGNTAIIMDNTDRKQAERVLQENEALISSLFTAMPAGVALLKDRVLLKVNHALSRITGFSEQEMLSKTTQQLYPNDGEYYRVARDVYSEMEREGLGIGEAQLKHKNGSLIDVLLCLSPLDSTDISKGTIATILDISDRIRAEKALRENEALISSLFASVPVGIALIKDRVLLKVNNTLCKMTGYSEAELLGSVSQKLYINDEEFIRTGREIYGQIEREGIGIGEARLLHKNGAFMDTLLCLSPLDPSDTSKGITVTVLDITDRKQAEAALRESEKKYRSVIENIQDVFYRADLDGQVVMGSPSGAKMLGYDSVDDMIGKPFYTFWSDPAERQKLITQIKATGFVKDFETILTRKDGSTFFASFTTQLFYDDNGDPLGTEGIIRDISEQRKAEEEIRQLNEELEQRVHERTKQLEIAVQELEAFSYSVSHDLRAPLRAINGYANILREDYSPILDAEGNRVCGVITKETQRMSRLIDDLLSFSRIGRVELQPHSIDMQALANSVFLDLTTSTEQRRISFQVEPLEFAVGDANLLRQVWMNLISNAIKFTSQKEQAIIQISSEHNENEVIYSIKDNGAGFDMRYAQNLFGVFNRLHSEKDFEGTGVGLAIVQRIINRHGGRVWGEGDVDKGAIFHFSLPKREAVS